MLALSGHRGRYEAAPNGARQRCEDDDPAKLLRAVIERTVAAAFELEPELLRLPTRGRRRAVLARHVAMYLAHVSCRMTYTEIGHAFGRDRSTVAYACAQVEQRREDKAFDRGIELLESIVRVVACMWPPDS